MPVLIQEDVAGLQVPVHHVLFLQEAQDYYQLRNIKLSRSLIQCFIELKVGTEIAVESVIEDHIHILLVRERRVEMNNILML